MAVTGKKSRITSWKPDPKNPMDQICDYDGKKFILYFEKIFDMPKLARYDDFMIKKGSYENQLDTITKYVNFFMRFYDTDNELAMAYFKIKKTIDDEASIPPDERTYNIETYRRLIDLIYELMFTPNICKKICQMVEENYLDDIENSDDKKKYGDKEKKHLESLEFTNQHIKILLRISFGMKVIAPVLFHFVYINVIKLDRDSKLIFNFYEPLFDVFSDDVNIYNKLFVYVKAKVLDNKSHNALMYDQRGIFGVDEYTIINQFLRKVIISENMVKFKFNEHWDPKQKKYRENINGFIKTIIKYQLSYFLKEQYGKNLSEVTFEKNADGLSGMDKMEMNLSKIDEGRVNMTIIGVSMEVQKIIEDNDFGITDEEIDYYVANHKPSLFQKELVYSYYAKYFGSYDALCELKRREYIMLLLILKKKLLIEAGYSEDNLDDSEATAKLPYILTGNVSDKLGTRIIRNNKFVNKIEENYIYNKLITSKYSNLYNIKPEYILSILSTLINTTFTYVVYEDQSLLGKPIEYSEDKISDEALFFLNSF